MAIRPLYLKRNDTQPYYFAQLVDSSNNPVDLTGASIVFTMKLVDGPIKVNRQAATITNATNGEFEYRWSAGDTDTPGIYNIEFEITLAGGGKLSAPANEDAQVIIKESLDTI